MSLHHFVVAFFLVTSSNHIILSYCQFVSRCCCAIALSHNCIVVSSRCPVVSSHRCVVASLHCRVVALLRRCNYQSFFIHSFSLFLSLLMMHPLFLQLGWARMRWRWGNLRSISWQGGFLLCLGLRLRQLLVRVVEAVIQYCVDSLQVMGCKAKY